ncbi:hypothetical protein SAMN06298216_3575 [Spirosomataceae bacterium TFI 002]|nr:hypothetical protein SAMN06298216_3575 [Spirosomataceae bacterium TFI 002]
MTQDELYNLQSIALSQFKTSKSLFEKTGGVLSSCSSLKQFLVVTLKSEMERHLKEAEPLRGNKLNEKDKNYQVEAVKLLFRL